MGVLAEKHALDFAENLKFDGDHWSRKTKKNPEIRKKVFFDCSLFQIFKVGSESFGFSDPHR